MGDHEGSRGKRAESWGSEGKESLRVAEGENRKLGENRVEGQWKSNQRRRSRDPVVGRRCG